MSRPERIIQLTDTVIFNRTRTRMSVLQGADVVIGADGTLLKAREAEGGQATAEQLDRAIPYPDAQDEADEIIKILTNMHERGAVVPEFQGAIDRYVVETYGASNALKQIAAERVRQINELGYGEEHDDQHTGHELAYEAMARIGVVLDVLNVPGGVSSTGNHPLWSAYETAAEERAYYAKVKADPARVLVKAAALLCAEIDRLQRVDTEPEEA